MSNKRVRGDLLEARMDSGEYPPKIMFFQNEKYDCVTKTFTGDISYAPDTMQGYSVARFVMIFSHDFFHIQGGYRTTDIDGHKHRDEFGKWKHFRYRKFVQG